MHGIERQNAFRMLLLSPLQMKPLYSDTCFVDTGFYYYQKSVHFSTISQTTLNVFFSLLWCRSWAFSTSQHKDTTKL